MGSYYGTSLADMPPSIDPPSEASVSHQISIFDVFNANSSPGSSMHSYQSNQARQYALADASETFCPLALANDFPVKFVPREHRAAVSSRFFRGLGFWNRIWDLYFVRQDQVFTPREPLILVPERQVCQLLREISDALGLDVRMPENAQDIGLVLSFPKRKSFRPRWLGRSTSMDEYVKLKQQVLTYEEWRHLLQNDQQSRGGDSDGSDDSVADEFNMMMDQTYELMKKSSAAHGEPVDDNKRRKKVEKRVARVGTWKTELIRAQQYFGFRFKYAGGVPEPTEGSSWAEVQAYHESRKAPSATVVPSRPAPFQHPREPVLISIDVEWYEQDPNKVTEIGVASLDTRHLAVLPPGEHGVKWQNKIHARHFRIRENMHLRNGKYVDDAADGFLFGSGKGSGIIGAKDIPRVLASVFRPPFCLDLTDAEATATMTGHVRDLDLDNDQERRKLVLVGHDIKSDISKLAQVGFNATQIGGVKGTVDTADMYRALTGDDNAPRLTDILLEFGMTPWKAHNAGNDAVYTLHAMIAVALECAMTRKLL